MMGASVGVGRIVPRCGEVFEKVTGWTGGRRSVIFEADEF